MVYCTKLVPPPPWNLLDAFISVWCSLLWALICVTILFSDDAYLNISLENYNITSAAGQLIKDTKQLPPFSAIILNVTKIPETIRFIIVQAHTFQFNVTLSYNDILKPHSFINGTNLGLVQLIDENQTTAKFYIRNENARPNVTVLITVQGYGEEGKVLYKSCCFVRWICACMKENIVEHKLHWLLCSQVYCNAWSLCVLLDISPSSRWVQYGVFSWNCSIFDHSLHRVCHSCGQSASFSPSTSQEACSSLWISAYTAWHVPYVLTRKRLFIWKLLWCTVENDDCAGHTAECKEGTGAIIFVLMLELSG